MPADPAPHRDLDRTARPRPDRAAGPGGGSQDDRGRAPTGQDAADAGQAGALPTGAGPGGSSPSPDRADPAQDLLAAALAVRERSYAPYSGYRVGAALRDAEGRIHAGANVENAAYPQGQCAEASAIGLMIAAGGRQIVEALVVADATSGVPTPCGGCRQRLREFMPLDAPVHLAGPDGILWTVTLGHLLPLSFGPEYLDKESPA